MKIIKDFFVVALILITVSACEGFGYSKNSRTGSGNVITKEVNIQPFSKIEINGIIDVILEQGVKESARIETDDNLMSLIDVRTEGSTLFIALKKDSSIRKSTKLNVFVTLVNITHLTLNGVGDLETNGILELNDLYIETTGVGDIKLAIDCTSLSVDNSSVGDISLFGKTRSLKVNNSGVGDIYAYELTTDYAFIKNSGVGDVEVNVMESIEIESSGVGDVEYTGNPTVNSGKIQ